MHFTATRSRFEQRSEAAQPLLRAAGGASDRGASAERQPEAAPEAPAPLLPAAPLVFPPASHAVHRSLPPPAPDEAPPPSPQAARQLDVPPPGSFSRPPVASADAYAQPDGAARPAPLGLTARPCDGGVTPCLLPRLGSGARARVRTPGHALSVSADGAALGALAFREPLVSSDDNLKVVVRVRPMSDRELDAGARLLTCITRV